MAPKTCCVGGASRKPTDGWYCGCICLNGVPQMTIALILVFVGFLFSLVTLGDCKFAIIDEGFYSPVLYAADFNDVSRRGVGFLTFEAPGGGCYYYDTYGVDQSAVLRSYTQAFLGNDWNIGRFTAVTTVILSLFTWFYMWSFLCSAQPRECRFTIGGILCVLLTTMQGLTFTALTSSWCSENGCELSRSSGLSIGALLCFFFAGLCFFVSSNYPGASAEEAVAAKGEEVEEEEEQDPEQPVVVEEEEDKEDAEENEDKEEQAPKEEADDAPEEADEEAAGDAPVANVEVPLDDLEVSTEMEA